MVKEIKRSSKLAQFFLGSKYEYECEKHPVAQVEQSGIMRGVCRECVRDHMREHDALKRAERIAEMREAFEQALGKKS